MTAKSPVSAKVLQGFVPLSSLTNENRQKLAEKTYVEQLAAGGVLFKQGDIDNWSFYILSGEVVLSGSNAAAQSVTGGSGVAKHPLAHQLPRQLTATAKGAINFMRIDSQLLDLLLTWDQQVAGYEVTELGGASGDDNEWMIKLLQTQSFLRLPAANIQTLFAKLAEVPMQAGQAIVKQGDKGDYFYIIKSGSCQVSRKASDAAAPIALAELGVGDSFGEEALLSDVPRNATVTATADGLLMRLAKSDFVVLLKEPLVNWVTQPEAIALAKDGAGVIDVRLEKEFQNGNIKGSINMPLYLLRMKMETLDPKRKYVVYCDTGRRSAAAAYLLSQRGLEVYVLKNGLVAARPGAAPAATAPART